MRPPASFADGPAELFDDPHADGALVVRSLRGVARSNRWLGGTAAALCRVEEFLRAVPPGTTLTLLDVGTGVGDIPRAAARRAGRRGIALRLIGLERHLAAARASRHPGDLRAVRGDARALPFRDRAVDLVLCSQVLHHFPPPEAISLLTAFDRVARLGVVVADLWRSPIAAAGIWLASFPLGFHPLTRRDGVSSVRRGYRPEELRAICERAGVRAEVRRHHGYRITAAWTPNDFGR